MQRSGLVVYNSSWFFFGNSSFTKTKLMMCAPNFGRFQFAPAKKSPAFSGRHRGSLEFGGRRRAAETTAAPTAAEQVGKAGEGKLGVLGEELGSGIFDGFLNV